MINQKIQEELRKEYNPEGSILRRAQLRMLEILRFVDEVCRKYNLVYWLDSGTLLGAVRHGGFIPWDNDIDIVMPRKELKKLAKILKLPEYKDSQFQLQSRETDPGFFDYWYVMRDTKSEYIMETRIQHRRKYRGLQVDIFPVEEGISKKLCNFANQIKCRTIDRMTFRPFPNMAIAIPDFVLRYITFPILRKFRSSDTKDKYLFDFGIPFDNIIDIDTVYPLTEIEIEGYKFKAPGNSEVYLKDMYEDWESLPEKQNRLQSTHANKIRLL